jgi:hypothetical protein
LSARSLAAIAFGVAALGAVVVLITIRPPAETVVNLNGNVQTPTPFPTATGANANVAVTVTPTPQPPTQTPTPPTSIIKQEPPPLFYVAVAAALLLLLLLYALLRRGLRALDPSRYENKRPPFKWPLRASAPAFRLYDSEEFRQAARLLRRRQVDEFFRLDIRATVSATIRSLGYPSFRYKPATRVPEYLALVERASPHDHQARLFDEMVKALRREGLIVTRYFYKDDPLLCCDEGGENCVRLERLKQRHAGHRLLLFGSGGQLLDPVTGRMAEGAEVFSEWHERAVLTPESAWGWREHVLSEKFVVVPADARGLLRLVNHFESPAARSSSGWPAQGPRPLPPVADDPRPLDDVLKDVRAYLGPQLFQWLCACGVYTELRWGLTLTLGSLRSMPAGLVNEESLLRLSRLVWFREGAIPDALRARLIEALEPMHIKQTREELIRLLEASPPPPDTFASDLYGLELALQRWLSRKDKKSLGELRGALRRMPRRQVSRSEVLTSYLKAVPHRFFGRRLPGLFYRRGIPALGLSALVQGVLALALVAAALAAIRARAEDVPQWAYSPFVNANPTPTPQDNRNANSSPANANANDSNVGGDTNSNANAASNANTNNNLNGNANGNAGNKNRANTSSGNANGSQRGNTNAGNGNSNAGPAPTPDTRPVPPVASLADCPPGGLRGSDALYNAAKNRTDRPAKWRRFTLKEIRALPEPGTWAHEQDRTQLASRGEGQAVQVVGYLISARQQGAESCNCQLTGPNNTDMHLDLVDSPSDPRAMSVTAEMTPRNRPPSWTISILKRLANTQAYVRVTGLLFLDTEHVGRSPLPRATNWEIHPVTMFEVCTAASKEICDQGQGWVTLENYAAIKE